MSDVLITDFGSGGDARQQGQDLATASGYENQVYLALFGGASWWANALIDDPDERVQSRTEQVLQSVALNSAGRQRIEEAVKADLDYIARTLPGTEVKVSVSITDTDRVRIAVTLEGQEVVLQWNPDTETLEQTI